MIDVLHAFDAVGIDAWVEGGWGVDALVGRQLRTHKDVDLVVRLSDSQRVLTLLESRGFKLLPSCEPALPVLAPDCSIRRAG